MGFPSMGLDSGPDDMWYVVETQHGLLAVLEKVLEAPVNCVLQNQVEGSSCGN